MDLYHLLSIILLFYLEVENMKSIKVIIEETISQVFVVQVSENSKYPLEDALNIAQEKYKNGYSQTR